MKPNRKGSLAVYGNNKAIVRELITNIQTRIRWLQHWLFVNLRKIRLPGFRGAGLYDVLRFFLYGLTDAKFSLMAAAMAYNFFFSLFPTVILILIVITLLPMPQLEETIMDFFGQVLLPEGMDLVQSIVDQVFNPNKGEAIGLISLTAFLSLRGATRGMIAMTRAFTKDEEVFKKRNLFQTYGTALIILFVLGGLFLFSIGVLAGGEYLVHYLLRNDLISAGIQSFLLKMLNYGISLFMLIFSISSIYYLVPAIHQRWKFITPGSVMASILTLLTIIGFSWFFSNFGLFNQIYGSLAAIILLMLWFYYISIVLLIGFELNAAIDIAHYHHDKEVEFRNQDVAKNFERDELPPIILIDEDPELESDLEKQKEEKLNTMDYEAPGEEKSLEHSENEKQEIKTSEELGEEPKPMV